MANCLLIRAREFMMNTLSTTTIIALIVSKITQFTLRKIYYIYLNNADKIVYIFKFIPFILIKY